jgi:hypothetical protein
MAAKKWIAGAVKHPGRMKRAAAKAGESTHSYMEQHKGDKGSTGAAARLGLRLEGMHAKAGKLYNGNGAKK